MSRRTRYGRAQHATARGPRGDASRARPVGPVKTSPAPAASTNGHVADAVPATAPNQSAPPKAPRAAATESGPVTATAPRTGPLEAGASAMALAAHDTNGTHPPQGAEPPGATAPQLRRFIKSRTYVPMHELRRRFGINGGEDDVTLVDMDGRHIFVGLPAREGRLLGELLRGGDVGYELSLDPRSPIVVGVYPMRPVPRP